MQKLDIVHQPNLEDFERKLADLINELSLENLSDTPDFILARYLTLTLINFSDIRFQTIEWHKSSLTEGFSKSDQKLI